MQPDAAQTHFLLESRVPVQTQFILEKTGAITDRYIDVELSARAKSARHKSIGTRDFDQ